MILFRVKPLFISVFCFSILSFAQKNVVTYDLKKGEAFDILLLATKPDSEEALKEYREKAFPVAVEMGYSFLPGFKISETTQGNYQPKSLIFGKWESLTKREKFLTEIDNRVANFHDMRKEIWSLFNLTYYEVQEDTSFEVDTNKIIVATSFWKKDESASGFESFINQWKNTLQKMGGNLKIELVNGDSPFGYYYNPDYFAISQWENRGDFDLFLKKNMKMDTDALKNVNQFILGK